MHYILVVLSLLLRNRGLWRPASVFSMWWCDDIEVTRMLRGKLLSWNFLSFTKPDHTNSTITLYALNLFADCRQCRVQTVLLAVVRRGRAVAGRPARWAWLRSQCHSTLYFHSIANRQLLLIYFVEGVVAEVLSVFFLYSNNLVIF